MKAEEASREVIHIGVIMIGYGDRISIRQDARERFVLGSPEWREEYGRRVDRFIKVLKRRNLALYWVSQPIMRRFEVNDPAQMMNDIVRDKAYLNGIKFIDIQAQFADEAGNYSAYGPDITGRQRLLREADGVFVHLCGQPQTRPVRRAGNQARSVAGPQGTIDPAGRQRKRAGAHQCVAAARPCGCGCRRRRKTARPRASDAKQNPAPSPPAMAAPTDGVLDQKAEQRPHHPKKHRRRRSRGILTRSTCRGRPFPPAVVALVTRNQSSERAAAMGDVVADEIGGGLVVLSSITPATSGSALNRRQAPSQAPYYHVLIKGERLQAKPGRADDFGWPRVEPDIPEPEPVRRRDPTAPKPARRRAAKRRIAGAHQRKTSRIARASSRGGLRAAAFGRRRPRSSLLRWARLMATPSILRKTTSKASRKRHRQLFAGMAADPLMANDDGPPARERRSRS